MEQLKKIFNSFEKNIKHLDKFHDIVLLHVDAPENALFEAAPAASFSPRDRVGEAFAATLPFIPYYKGFASEAALKRDFFANIAGHLSYFSFADRDSSRVYFAQLFAKEADVRADARTLSALFQETLGVGVTIDEGDAPECKRLLADRLEAAKQFFLDEKGPWIHAFLDGLQDEISRISFLTFLRQRIYSKIFFDNDICIPVRPPAATLPWRTRREALPQTFPKLFGVNNAPLDELHFKHVFVYQQYCVPGVVEPLPGHCVVDAGAFVGDTTAWFAQMVGTNGRVHAFEPSPQNVRRGEDNMRINGFANVVFHDCALSDKNGRASIKVNPVWGSADKIEHDDEGEITLLRLDDAGIRGRIDFIKSDTEGSEMALLRGAAQTIQRDAPVCAICLYHKRDDFWQIPDYLKELRPDYAFWFRCEAEPVLFAKQR